MESRFEVHKGPGKVFERKVVTLESDKPSSFTVSSLGVAMGLTPRIKSLNSFHVFRITLEKHITDDENGETLAELKIDYPYALDLPDDITPVAEEIYDMMQYASLEFAAEWYQLLSDTRFEKHRLSDLFEFEPLKDKIERTIDFWEDSLRDKILD